MVSRAFTYFNQVGVLNNFQNGIFNSNIPTFLKNVVTASINCWVSMLASSSKQPSRTSNATRAIAIKKKWKETV